jgi:D-alanyl-D-alanine carboxypeptidase
MHAFRLDVALILLLATGSIAHAGEAAITTPSACTSDATDDAYRVRIAAIDRALGIADGYAGSHHMGMQPEARALRVAGKDIYGRPLRLDAGAAAALTAMSAAALRDRVVLQAVSGFRSVGYQRGLLQRKLEHGMSLDAALRINAAPGYSEHHTGCAVDLTTPGYPPADARFANSPAYRWLLAHATDYGFRLSYPPNNPQGIDYEPWHWRYVPPTPVTRTH